MDSGNLALRGSQLVVCLLLVNITLDAKAGNRRLEHSSTGTQQIIISCRASAQHSCHGPNRLVQPSAAAAPHPALSLSLPLSPLPHLQGDDDHEEFLVAVGQHVFDERPAGTQHNDRHKQQRPLHPADGRERMEIRQGRP